VPSPVAGRGVRRFRLAEPGHVRLVLYDARGRKERVLLEGQEPAGDGSVAFDATGLRQGVYLARLETAVGSAVSKIVVLDR